MGKPDCAQANTAVPLHELTHRCTGFRADRAAVAAVAWATKAGAQLARKTPTEKAVIICAAFEAVEPEATQ